VNSGKAEYYAKNLLKRNNGGDDGQRSSSRLLAPVNRQQDYWLKQEYRVYDQDANVRLLFVVAVVCVVDMMVVIIYFCFLLPVQMTVQLQRRRGWSSTHLLFHSFLRFMAHVCCLLLLLLFLNHGNKVVWRAGEVGAWDVVFQVRIHPCRLEVVIMKTKDIVAAGKWGALFRMPRIFLLHTLRLSNSNVFLKTV